MYLDRPPVTTFSAEFLATEWYRKLLSTKTGMFVVIEVTLTTVVIDEDGICNTVSLNRPTVAPTTKETPTQDEKMQTEEKEAEREEKHTGDTRTEEENIANALREYSVDRKVSHVGRGNNVKYVVGWYGYTAADDTVQPTAHIPEHFITRYWCRGRKNTQGDRDREEEIEDDKECKPPTAQAGTLMIVHRRNTSKYPGYMLELSMIGQGRSNYSWLLYTAVQSMYAMSINYQCRPTSGMTMDYL